MGRDDALQDAVGALRAALEAAAAAGGCGGGAPDWRQPERLRLGHRGRTGDLSLSLTLALSGINAEQKINNNAYYYDTSVRYCDLSCECILASIILRSYSIFFKMPEKIR